MGLATIEKIVSEKQISGYFGPLIDNFSLSNPAFQTAVEVAGGNSLFHVIVDNETTAAMLIKELDRCNGGRLTFLPLNRVKVPRVTYPQNPDVRPLIDVALVYEEKFAPAIKMVS
jgi:structural maintenance of chromosome 3 (chondroitin sulfate proteoglycan 6)